MFKQWNSRFALHSAVIHLIADKPHFRSRQTTKEWVDLLSIRLARHAAVPNMYKYVYKNNYKSVY